MELECLNLVFFCVSRVRLFFGDVHPQSPIDIDMNTMTDNDRLFLSDGSTIRPNNIIYIYIYISKPLEQQILLCWCRCQDERLRVPSKHAQWHRSCVRGDSRRRNSAAEIAGRKRSEPIGGWKIEGTPKARYFKVNLWKHLKRRSMGTYSETQMKLTGMIFWG